MWETMLDELIRADLSRRQCLSREINGGLRMVAKQISERRIVMIQSKFVSCVLV